MKKWLKDNWIILVIVGFVVMWLVIMGISLNSDSAKEWFNKSYTKITVGDIFIIVVVHAFINRSDKK
jgi:hypothetical protein